MDAEKRCPFRFGLEVAYQRCIGNKCLAYEETETIWAIGGRTTAYCRMMNRAILWSKEWEGTKEAA